MPKKILIIGPSWVGDMVMAQTLFIALKQQNPELTIDVLAPAWSLPILERMPEVRQAVVMPIGHGKIDLPGRYRLAQQLRGEHYEQAILLPNSFKSALLPLLAGIPLRTGWRGEMRYGLLNDLRILDAQRYPLMIERFIALAYPDGDALPDPLPRPSMHTDAKQCASRRKTFALDDQRPVLALCPGAEFGNAKRWPEAYYAELAAERIAAGWQVWLFGSVNDQPVTETIQNHIAALSTLPSAEIPCVDLAGKTSLAEAIDLISLADLVASNDSGLMHVAAALGRPLVVVYGSTSPKFTPPLNDQVRILSIPVDCGPCFQRECPQQHLKCLKDLQPEKVIAAARELLAEGDEGEKS